MRQERSEFLGGFHGSRYSGRNILVVIIFRIKEDS